MSNAVIHGAQILRFCRQFLQLEPSPRYPDGIVLREELTQEMLYQRLFKSGAVSHPPPARYQLRVLKELLSRIESSIEDWEIHGISESLVTPLSELLSVPHAPEATAAQQRSYVTYHQSLLDADPSGRDPVITLLEARSVVSAAGTTGLRTWEACLHLGQYLCVNPSITRGKRILELGAGTGYLSILCAKYLCAEHVVVSDGSDDVINNLSDSLYLNGLQGSDAILPMELKWGHALTGNEVPEWNDGRSIDVVLGADITYDRDLITALVGTLQDISALSPQAQIIITATERNLETLESFLGACERVGYKIDHVDFPLTAIDDQMGPFYDVRTPIHIFQLRPLGHSQL